MTKLYSSKPKPHYTVTPGLTRGLRFQSPILPPVIARLVRAIQSGLGTLSGTAC